MKKAASIIASLFAMMISVDNSTPTIVSVPDGSWIAVVPYLCEDPAEIVPISTVTVTATATVISTGPVVMKAQNSADCYRIDGMNSNGTPIPASPFPWVPCE